MYVCACVSVCVRLLQELWPRLKNLKWMHSSSAGLEHLLFPELRDGPVVLTNAKVWLIYTHTHTHTHTHTLRDGPVVLTNAKV